MLYSHICASVVKTVFFHILFLGGGLFLGPHSTLRSLIHTNTVIARVNLRIISLKGICESKKMLLFSRARSIPKDAGAGAGTGTACAGACNEFYGKVDLYMLEL